ncbi:alpha-mannosidase [Hydrogenoanaerobacterium saccharovorans]|uniref:Alpha-mannosidase n=1 Tax=Hydrogenoanaerobacterium saccharovorans TaxID=474960 RepID=A0A1H7ZS91_9FIRM|nr:alpha-mannosidase [Hydrogenoanaerobacterium saccharovorans]RPF48417.1 alpha-mannosidase [Hydrogenoanaerobacterium saccharovorans]SEM61300.1 alpha-mannosidase [Hydrogenoanaerobacterium saccharovorans]
MIFAKERVEVIAAQLKKFSVTQKFSLTNWEMKQGFWLTPDAVQNDGASWQAFESTKMHWYGPDKHYWFRTAFTVPASYEGKSLWILLRTQIEEWDDAKNPQFLVFVNGEPIQGADMNHREIKITDKAHAGDRYTIDLQAHTGILHTEFNLFADVMEICPAVEALYYDIQVPLWALARMDEKGKTAIDILTVLNNTINLLDLRDVPSHDFYNSVDAARSYIQKALYTDMAGFDEVIATCVGHTHIDVAWWWTVQQTREKVARSFATVLKLMEEYPEYQFMSSQPVLYTFLKERYPELYEQVKQRIKEKRWEPEGGMWVEADCNITSGESLVRQFLYGKRFFKEEFGADNHVLWLPDVFGYSGALPQIMKKCGIDYFMTTKLSWNQFNKVPNDTLLWEGIDGTKVLTHFISTLGVGQSVERFFTTYNGMLHPDSIMGGWERYQNKEMNNDILISYGYGDGGGGPTRAMLETGRRMEQGIKGVPKVRQTGSRQYFEELEQRVKDSPRLQTWTGEFYFEYHRGTYTSMARNKRANRKSELALMDLELLSVLAAEKGVAYPAELEQLWKTVLLNQFHDILPGSSIEEVYEVTKKEYQEIAEKSQALITERKAAIAGAGNGVTVFNTLGFHHEGLVALPDGIAAIADEHGTLPSQVIGGTNYALVKNIPSKGYTTFAQAEAIKNSPSPFKYSAKNDGYTIETPFYKVDIDGDGAFSSLFDKQNEREIITPQHKCNQLRVYEDKPIYYDNWDIDVFYTEKFWNIDGVTSMEWTSVGPLCAELTVERSFMHSKMSQRIRFYAHTQRIDFDTWVDWKEHQHLLKVHFPVDVHTDEATFDIQFGNVARKTHTNTSWDMARFESCAHKWMDVSEGGYGVSLLNDCKYGHSVSQGNIGLTLIKSGIEPNPNTDVEEHVFTYSLYPHEGTWRTADTQQQAADLNSPMTAICGGTAGTNFSFASLDKDNVVLETVKQAENGKGIVVRIYESRNMRTNATLALHTKPSCVTECDLLENPQSSLQVTNNCVTFTIKPYEIKTLLLTF